jgi:hypothetical protein
MSNYPRFVKKEHIAGPLQAIRAGKLGDPEIRTKMGVKAVGTLVYTGNHVAGDTHTINGVTFTCMASGASGELQYNVAGSLTLSIDALVTKLNACTDPRVTFATYSNTGGTTLTVTSDSYLYSDNGIVLSSTHSTTVATNLTGGSDRDVSLETSTTVFNLPGATTEVAYLADGEQGQLKIFVMQGSGTVNLSGANLAATNYAFNGDDALVLMFLRAKWRVILNDGVTAT